MHVQKQKQNNNNKKKKTFKLKAINWVGGNTTWIFIGREKQKKSRFKSKYSVKISYCYYAATLDSFLVDE